MSTKIKAPGGKYLSCYGPASNDIYWIEWDLVVPATLPTGIWSTLISLEKFEGDSNGYIAFKLRKLNGNVRLEFACYDDSGTNDQDAISLSASLVVGKTHHFKLLRIGSAVIVEYTLEGQAPATLNVTLSDGDCTISAIHIGAGQSTVYGGPNNIIIADMEMHNVIGNICKWGYALNQYINIAEVGGDVKYILNFGSLGDVFILQTPDAPYFELIEQYPILSVPPGIATAPSVTSVGAADIGELTKIQNDLKKKMGI